MPYCASNLQPQIIGVDSVDLALILLPLAYFWRLLMRAGSVDTPRYDHTTWVATDTNSYELKICRFC